MPESTSTDDWAPQPMPGVLDEYARMRAGCPVAHTQEYGGYWTLSTFADVVGAARRHGTFRSGQPFVEFPEFTQSIPIGSNPPEHAFFRRALNRYFVPARMAELEPTVRASTVEHLAPMLARGHGDYVAEFARSVPARSLAALLNMPDTAWQALVAHLDALVEEVARAGDTGEEPLAFNPLDIFAAEVVRLVEARRREPLDPEHDLISGILALERDGQPLAEDLVVAIGVQIIAAGHETTTQALSSAVHALAIDEDAQARLRRAPELIPGAIEELLRLEPPLHQLARTATEDVELHGRTIPAGDLVTLNFASANRDDREFPDPDACVLDRTPNRHLSFGHGVHKCVGAPLARLEMRLALEELLARTSSFALDGVAVVMPRKCQGGFEALPLRLRV